MPAASWGRGELPSCHYSSACTLTAAPPAPPEEAWRWQGTVLPPWVRRREQEPVLAAAQHSLNMPTLCHLRQGGAVSTVLNYNTGR